MAFLDIEVLRNNEGFFTSIFRKRTFTGLGTNFYSSCCFNFKLSSLNTLFHRAFTLTSSWSEFHKEVLFLQKYFFDNYLPEKLFFKHLNKFLNGKIISKVNFPTVPKNPFYASLPFIQNN